MTNKNIYILCPPNLATGGPEALHQLGYILNDLGCKVKMLYSKFKINPVHPFYKSYNVPYTFAVKDDVNSIIIIPESMTNWISKFKYSEKKVWWLSLDFYQILMNSRNAKKNLLRKLIVPHKHNEYNFESNESVFHIFQSQRTKEFLETKFLNNRIEYLCDYVNDLFFENLPELNHITKSNIITYNPKKGIEKLKHIIDSLPQYNWKPLEGMSREEIRDLLRKTKLHIDFGYFPGRDKIPREALVSGCCLITGREGTAGFKDDLDIPNKYKLFENEITIENVTTKIKNVMDDFDNVQQDFVPFRNFVLMEKSRMINDVKQIFR